MDYVMVEVSMNGGDWRPSAVSPRSHAYTVLLSNPIFDDGVGNRYKMPGVFTLRGE
jgi:hypothetical protein